MTYKQVWSLSAVSNLQCPRNIC